MGNSCNSVCVLACFPVCGGGLGGPVSGPVHPGLCHQEGWGRPEPDWWGTGPSHWPTGNSPGIKDSIIKNKNPCVFLLHTKQAFQKWGLAKCPLKDLNSRCSLVVPCMCMLHTHAHTSLMAVLTGVFWGTFEHQQRGPGFFLSKNYPLKMLLLNQE